MNSKLRIFDQNYIDADLLASYSASSEKGAFPIENAFNGARRAKVWRSNGFFKIEAANGQIVFNEGGPNLTAIILPAEYVSTVTFLSAVKAALELQGAFTYTVTQLPSFRFRIQASSAFSLVCSDLGFTSLSVLGFASTDRSSATAHTADFLKISTGEFIDFDMGISSKPSAFAMLGPRNLPLKLSPNGVFKLKGNHTNNFLNPVYSQTLTYDSEVMAVLSDETLDSMALRFWRLEFSDQNPNGFVEIGAFFLGTYFSPQRGRGQFPFSSGYIDRTENVTSEGGQLYADIKEQTQEFNFEWSGLEIVDVEAITDFFRRYGLGYSFFVSFDSGSVFSSRKERMIKLVKFSAQPGYTLVSPNNFNCSMKFQEEI